MKENKELTMFDFFKHIKVAMFTLSMRKDFANSRVYTYLRWMVEDKQTSSTPFLRLWNVYKEVFPNLKRKEMNAVWEKYNKLREERNRNRRTNLHPRYTILSIGQYNAWANKVWRKKGSPRFHKRIISNVIFGRPYNDTMRRGRTIVRRYIGVEIEDGVRIKISVVK